MVKHTQKGKGERLKAVALQLFEHFWEAPYKKTLVNFSLSKLTEGKYQ